MKLRGSRSAKERHIVPKLGREALLYAGVEKSATNNYWNILRRVRNRHEES